MSDPLDLSPAAAAPVAIPSDGADIAEEGIAAAARTASPSVGVITAVFLFSPADTVTVSVATGAPRDRASGDSGGTDDAAQRPDSGDMDVSLPPLSDNAIWSLKAQPSPPPLHLGGDEET